MPSAERTETIEGSVVVHSEVRRVFDWWVGPSHWDLDRKKWDPGPRGKWDEKRELVSRRVEASWDNRKMSVAFASSSHWNRDGLRMTTDVHQESRHRDGRVTILDRHTLVSFTAVSPNKTDVGYITEFTFTGDWRRRDFLPGSVGHRRALHRDSFRLAVQECHMALDVHP